MGSAKLSIAPVTHQFILHHHHHQHVLSHQWNQSKQEKHKNFTPINNHALNPSNMSCEKSVNLLSLSATGGLVLLALYDSFLLATVLAGALAWAWYKHQSSSSSSSTPSYQTAPKQTPVQIKTETMEPKQEKLIESLDSFTAPKVEDISSSKYAEEDNILDAEEEFDKALEKSNVELIGSIQNFDSENLVPVKTKEPLSGAELLSQELSHESVKSEVENFDVDSLKKTDVQEKNWLPDQDVIEQEKEKVDHLAGIENFNTETLTKVKTPEPVTGVELLKQELTQKAIGEEVESYNKDALKHVDVEEKNLLPDTETLEAEKSRQNLLTGVEEFSKDSLSHVQTLEPLSGADLLKQELSMKSLNDSVSSFDSNTLKPSSTEEKNLLPDAETIKTEKDHIDFLKELESGHDLSPTVPREPLSGLDLLKQELTHKQIIENVSDFDKGQLKEVDVEEKTVLPDVDTIQSEKTHMEHLSSIASFDQSALSKVKVSEPMTGVELAKQESYRTSISDELVSFDKSELKPTETIEKVALPDDEVISSERQHQELITGVQAGVDLKKTDTREPINPLDLAKLETSKDQVEEEIQAFDRSRLTPVVTEERNFMPTADDIKTEALTKELDNLDQEQEVEAKGVAGLKDFLGKDEDSSSSPEELSVPAAEAAGGIKEVKDILERETRERSSSGEEWEKVSMTTEDIGGQGQGSSEC